MTDSGGGGCGCLLDLLDITSYVDMLGGLFEDWRGVLVVVLWLAGAVAIFFLLAYYDVAVLWYYISIGGYAAGTVGLLWAYNVAEVRRLR